MTGAGQLVFDLGTRAAMGREDFRVAPCNALALAQIEGWRDWPGRKLALTGPEGAGKTHLVHVFAALTGAVILDAARLRVDALPLDAVAVAVEDADRLPQPCRAEAEEALFHLHNALATRGAPLLFTGRAAPSRWPLALPDLASRLRAASIARVDPPDDALLAALLVKHFADRQITPPPDVIEYLLPRMDRSFAGAADIVARLDRAALRDRRPVTRKLASQVMRD